MKDLAQTKLDNAKAVAEKAGWRVQAVFDLYDDVDTCYPGYSTEASAWEAAALAVEEQHKAAATYLDPPPVAEIEPPLSDFSFSSALRTYSVIGRYFDNGYVFHDAVAAVTAKDAVDKVLTERNDLNRDWEVIAVLLGERIEDVTPLEFVE